MGSLSLLTLSNLWEKESITLLFHWFPVPVKVSRRSGSYSGIWWLSQHDMSGFLALATHLPSGDVGRHLSPAAFMMVVLPVASSGLSPSLSRVSFWFSLQTVWIHVSSDFENWVYQFLRWNACIGSHLQNEDPYIYRLRFRSHGVGGSVSCGATVSFYFTAVLFELPAMILSVDEFCDFLSLSVKNLTSGSCFRFVPVEQPVRSSVDDFPVGQFGGALSLGHVSRPRYLSTRGGVLEWVTDSPIDFFGL